MRREVYTNDIRCQHRTCFLKLVIYKAIVAETSPIPVRLSADLIERLDKMADQIGSNRAALIRFCTQTFLEHFEKRGVAALPPDWEQILAQTDNRTVRSRLALKEKETGKTSYPHHKPGNYAVNETNSKPASGAAKLLKKHNPSPGSAGASK